MYTITGDRQWISDETESQRDGWESPPSNTHATSQNQVEDAKPMCTPHVRSEEVRPGEV